MSLLIFSDKVSVAFGLADVMTQYVTLPILCFVMEAKLPFFSIVGIGVAHFLSIINKPPRIFLCARACLTCPSFREKSLAFSPCFGYNDSTTKEARCQDDSLVLFANRYGPEARNATGWFVLEWDWRDQRMMGVLRPCAL